MIVTTHQPIFLPWPGLFLKAMKSDILVLLDGVQFPRGRSWVNRNRLKNDQGTLWLTVPVWKKGRGLQKIGEVEICDELGWRTKHLRSIEQNYANAPYFHEYFPAIESIYEKHHTLLVELNIDLIRFLRTALSIKQELRLQSELGISGKGTELLINVCQHMNARRFLIFPVAERYLDAKRMRNRGIEIVSARVHPSIYPQLWGDFVYNLSALDLLMNCGPRSREIILEM